MEIIKQRRVFKLIMLLFLVVSCSKDDDIVEQYTYHYIKRDGIITAQQIGDGNGTFDPKGLAISDDKLYICNGDVLEVFNVQSLQHIKTINSYSKGDMNIEFKNLTSVAVDSSRIYVGTTESRLFVLDKKTEEGITAVGNGQWWNTFVHVFGVTVGEGLVFVK